MALGILSACRLHAHTRLARRGVMGGWSLKHGAGGLGRRATHAWEPRLRFGVGLASSSRRRVVASDLGVAPLSSCRRASLAPGLRVAVAGSARRYSAVQ